MPENNTSSPNENYLENETDSNLEMDESANFEEMINHKKMNQHSWFVDLPTNRKMILVGGSLLAVFIIMFGLLSMYMQSRNFQMASNTDVDDSFKSDSEVVDEILEASPLPAASAEPGASPEADANPDPTPVASPEVETLKANLHFTRTPKLFAKKIVRGDRRETPEGHITSDDGYSFYYQLESQPQQADESSFNFGTQFYLGVTVQNSEITKSAATNVLASLLLPDNKKTSKSFDLKGLDKGQTFDFSYNPSEINSVVGNVELSLLIDAANKVAETNEEDNSYNRTITINPDKTAPYLEIYPQSLEQSGDSVCFDYRAVFSRDDLDAVDGTGPSKRTQIRWKTSLDSGFTGWVDYTQMSATYPNKRCETATAGSDYTLFVEARDQNGNFTALSKTITVN